MSDRFTEYVENWFKEREITVSTIKGFKSALGRHLKAPSSIRRYIAAAKPWLALQRLEGRHNIDSDGVRILLKPPPLVREEPESLVAGDVRALLKAAAEYRLPNYAWFVLMSFTTGARPGEVVALQSSNFEPAKGRLRVFATKTMRARYVPLAKSTSLTALSKAALPPGKLFHLCGARGGPETHYWKALCEEAGLPPKEPRVMRSTVATCLASCGHLTLLEYTNWMGHSERTALDYYIDPNGKRAQGATIEAWLEAEAEFKALTARCLEPK